MDFRGLLDAWRTGGTSPRTATEYAVRLPIDDAARLAALADMFPGRTREQLITELLSVALDELATAMPYEAGRKVISHDDQGDPVYEDIGLTPKLLELTRKHRKRLQSELSK
ncbi:MAG: type 1 pili tip component [Steroidobacteraceae bacterium]